jgi:DNA-binding transcriptional LysR family regulator
VDLFVTRPAFAEPEPDIAYETLAEEHLRVVCSADIAWAHR